MLLIPMDMPKSCVYCDLRNIECDECGFTHFNLITECSEDIDNDYIRYLPLDWKSKHCPLIEAPEQKHGHWIVKSVGKSEYFQQEQYLEITCSVCKNHVAWPTNFCPNCGADMRGDSDV